MDDFPRRLSEDAYAQDVLFTTPCLRCGRTLELWWNGGELSEVECCSLVYFGAHGPTAVFVNTRENMESYEKAFGARPRRNCEC